MADHNIKNNIKTTEIEDHSSSLSSINSSLFLDEPAGEDLYPTAIVDDTGQGHKLGGNGTETQRQEKVQTSQICDLRNSEHAGLENSVPPTTLIRASTDTSAMSDNSDTKSEFEVRGCLTCVGRGRQCSGSRPQCQRCKKESRVCRWEEASASDASYEAREDSIILSTLPTLRISPPYVRNGWTLPATSTEGKGTTTGAKRGRENEEGQTSAEIKRFRHEILVTGGVDLVPENAETPDTSMSNDYTIQWSLPTRGIPAQQPSEDNVLNLSSARPTPFGLPLAAPVNLLSGEHVMLARVPSPSPLRASTIARACAWFEKLLTDDSGVDMMEIKPLLGVRIYREEDLEAYQQQKKHVTEQKAREVAQELVQNLEAASAASNKEKVTSSDKKSVDRKTAMTQSSTDSKNYTLRLKLKPEHRANRHYDMLGRPRSVIAHRKLAERDAAGSDKVVRVYETVEPPLVPPSALTGDKKEVDIDDAAIEDSVPKEGLVLDKTVEEAHGNKTFIDEDTGETYTLRLKIKDAKTYRANQHYDRAGVPKTEFARRKLAERDANGTGDVIRVYQ